MKLSTIARTGIVGLALAVASLAGIVTSSAPRANATSEVLVAFINGAQAASTCPGGSAGTGGGYVTYDTVTNMMTWDITFSGLSAAPGLAHFHGPAAPGVDAGIQVGIGDLTSPSQGSAIITDPQEAQLLSGLWYINYHTAMCPGGEVRGQVLLAGVGGVAGAPQLGSSAGGGSNWGMLAAMAATAAVVATLIGTGTLAWRRR